MPCFSKGRAPIHQVQTQAVLCLFILLRSKRSGTKMLSTTTSKQALRQLSASASIENRACRTLLSPMEKHRLQLPHPFPVLQVDADAQEVGGAGGLAALAADAVLHARGRGHLLRSVDGGWDHLKDVRGACADTERAADAGVVDLHLASSRT